MIGIGALAVVLLMIFEPEMVFLSAWFFLVGLILLVKLSTRGIFMWVVIYLAFFLASCSEPMGGIILTPLGIAIGYAAARHWDNHVEHDEEK